MKKLKTILQWTIMIFALLALLGLLEGKFESIFYKLPSSILMFVFAVEEYQDQKKRSAAFPFFVGVFLLVSLVTEVAKYIK